jgi:membrane protease YdiL (CAAX protease family)
MIATRAVTQLRSRRHVEQGMNALSQSAGARREARGLSRVVVDRPPREAAAALAAAWASFLAGLLVAPREVTDAASLAIAGAVGAVLVVVGFAAASRCRPLPRRPPPQRLRLLLLALGVGGLAGVGNLAANAALASLDPAIRAVLLERFARLDAMTALVGAPLVEEVALRLFVMSGLGWVVSRFTSRDGSIFTVAALLSAVVFALLHLDRAFPVDPAVARLYAGGLVLKYTLAGLVQSWAFWRWGLPYAIVAHAAVNATHRVLEPLVF